MDDMPKEDWIGLLRIREIIIVSLVVFLVVYLKNNYIQSIIYTSALSVYYFTLNSKYYNLSQWLVAAGTVGSLVFLVINNRKDRKDLNNFRYRQAQRESDKEYWDSQRASHEIAYKERQEQRESERLHHIYLANEKEEKAYKEQQVKSIFLTSENGITVINNNSDYPIFNVVPYITVNKSRQLYKQKFFLKNGNLFSDFRVPYDHGNEWIQKVPPGRWGLETEYYIDSGMFAYAVFCIAFRDRNGSYWYIENDTGNFYEILESKSSLAFLDIQLPPTIGGLDDKLINMDKETLEIPKHKNKFRYKQNIKINNVKR